jgi:hypothetical protein
MRKGREWREKREPLPELANSELVVSAEPSAFSDKARPSLPLPGGIEDMALPLAQLLGADWRKFGPAEKARALMLAQMATTAWNLRFLPPDEQKKQIDTLRRRFGERGPTVLAAFDQSLAALVQTVKAAFIDDHRLITRVEVVEELGRLRLIATGRRLPPPGMRPPR